MWGRSKMSKSIPVPPRGVELKSYPIPTLPTFWGGENPHEAKRGRVGQVGQGKIAIPLHQVVTLTSLAKMSQCLQRNKFRIYWGSQKLESMKKI